MAKLTLIDIASLSNQPTAINTINENFAAIETAIENTLSRDGTTPNSMSADLDLNSNDINNVGELETDTLIVGGLEVIPADLAVIYPEDGDKGDITVSGDGLVWTIDNSVVSTAKMGGDVTSAAKEWLQAASASEQRDLLDITSEITNIYDTKNIAENTVFSDTPTVIQIRGYHTVGDGGDALYVNPVTVDPNRTDTISVMVNGVETWYTRVHGDAIELIKHGLVGDGVTTETTLFQECVDLAETTGLRRVRGYPGKTYVLGSITLENDIEIDLNNCTFEGLVTSGSSTRMFTTEEADDVAVTIKNGTIDGTLVTAGVSGFGDRVLYFKGGDVVLENLRLQGFSNRLANVADGGGDIGIFDFASYRKGVFVGENVRTFQLNKTIMTCVQDEGFVIYSDDKSTLLTGQGNEWDKKSRDTFAAMSGTPLNVFNIHPASRLTDTYVHDTVKSALNLMTDGFTLDGFRIENVLDSTAVDMNEAASLAFTQFNIKNGYIKNIADTAGAGIRASAKSVIIENVTIEDIPSGRNGIEIHGTTAGADWQDTWWPAAGDYPLSGIRIKNIRVDGDAGSNAAVALIGASSTVPIRAEIDNIQLLSGGSQVNYAVDGTNAIVVAKGYWDVGDTASILLSDYGHVLGDSWVVDPDSAADVIIVSNIPTGTEIHLKDCRRIGSLGGSNFDINRGGTTTAAGVKLFLEGIIDSSGFGAPVLDGSIPVLKQGAYRATATYNPTSIAPRARTATQTVTVTGAAIGDHVVPGFTVDLANVKLIAWVSAANTVSYYFENAGTSSLLIGSGAYNPASATTGTRLATQTLTVTGAALGDMITGFSFGVDMQGMEAHYWVSATDTVSYWFENRTGGTIDLASSTVRVRIETQGSNVDLASGTVNIAVFPAL